MDARRRSSPGSSQVPFEQTLAAVQSSTVSAEDIRCYVNANLSRLERFVERELYFREAAEQMAAGFHHQEEVIDEVIAAALGDGGDKPEKLALEPWLYRLAIHAIGDLQARSSDNVFRSTSKTRLAFPTFGPATNPSSSSISRMKPSPRKV